jgi:3-oxoacyl-[acyl-carrier protein] reductase
MELGIGGRAAVVLASSAGIGRGIATSLAEAGVRVALSGRDGDRLERTVGALRERFGEVVYGEALDVMDGPALVAHLEGARARFGWVDILVTNAGGPPAGPAASLTLESLDRAYELTLKSAVRAIGTVLPWMRARGWGRIIAVTSSSVREPIPNLVLSNILRPALTGYLKTLAGEVAREGVLVNSVCTGAFETDRMLSLCRARAEASGSSVDEAIRQVGQGLPVGRVGQIEEYGALVAFLASEHAAFLTGAAIPLDGGASHGLF